MSDTRINPVKVASAAVIGAAATEAAILTKNYATKKFAQMPADAFVKKTVNGIGDAFTSAKTSINKKINAETIGNACKWVKGKLDTVKNTVVNNFDKAKQTIVKKLGEFSNKPAVNKIVKFAKNPLVIGAAVGVLAYIGVTKLLDKLNK